LKGGPANGEAVAMGKARKGQVGMLLEHAANVGAGVNRGRNPLHSATLTRIKVAMLDRVDIDHRIVEVVRSLFRM
jgi:hypothetical protein